MSRLVPLLLALALLPTGLLGSSIARADEAATAAQVPSLLGKSVDAARTLLEQRGLLADITYVDDAVAPAGTVIAQDPKSGSEILVGATIQLRVTGPDPDAGPTDDTPDADQVAVPALTGLGAPHWDPHARGAILGISRGTTAAHIARAAVESMAFQSRDLLTAMERDANVTLQSLKVDGGATVNDALLQFQADILDCAVERPVVAETTALGAAYLAGLAVGYWDGLDNVQANWALDRRFEPSMNEALRTQRCQQWDDAVSRSKAWDCS